MHTTLLRKPAVMSRCGRGNRGLYADIAAGVMVPPIKLGARASAWPEHEVEVEVVLRARIAGQSDAEIRAVVRELVSARKSAQGYEAVNAKDGKK